VADQKPKVLLLHNPLFDKQDSLMSLEQSGYIIEICHSQDDILQKLLNNPDAYYVLLLEYDHPNIDTSLLMQIRSIEFLSALPVIALSPNPTNLEIEFSLKLGAQCHLCRTLEKTIFLSVMKAVVAEHGRRQSLHNISPPAIKAAELLKEAKFRFRTLPEANLLASFLAQSCPNPRLAALGIAEILINAVEHGNLAIDYAEKSKLQGQNDWLEEVDRRLNSSENSEKHVDVTLLRTDSEIKIIVRDQGAGFDWKKFQDLDPRHCLESHGRGIVMARSLAFERLEYSEQGNEVCCMVALQPK
jgi:CheY-like chemotaxis protein